MKDNWISVNEYKGLFMSCKRELKQMQLDKEELINDLLSKIDHNESHHDFSIGTEDLKNIISKHLALNKIEKE